MFAGFSITLFLVWLSLLGRAEAKFEEKPLLSGYRFLYGEGALDAEMPLLWASLGHPHSDPFNVDNLDLYLIKPNEFFDGLPLDASMDWGVEVSLERLRPDPAIYDNAPGMIWQGFHYGDRVLTPAEAKPIYDANVWLAWDRLEFLYQFALNIYTQRGTIPKEKLPPKIQADLDSLRKGQRGVLYVTPRNRPNTILAMLTSKYENANGLLSFEERLVERGPGREIQKLGRPKIDWYSFDDNLYLDRGPTREKFRIPFDFQASELPGVRQWVGGGVLGEPKTLMQPGVRRHDAMALLHQMYLIHFRFSNQPIPVEFFQKIVNDPQFQLQTAFNFALEERVSRETGLYPLIYLTEYLLGPLTAQYLRFTDLAIEAMDDPTQDNPLLRFYTENLKFERVDFLASDPDLPHLNTHILRIPVSRFETETLESLRQRPGGELVRSGRLLPNYQPNKNSGPRAVFIQQWPHERAMARRYLSLLKGAPFWKAIEAKAASFDLGSWPCRQALEGLMYAGPRPQSILDTWGMDADSFLKRQRLR